MPEWDKFPCLGLAFEAAKMGGSLPCFMNAANEVLVHRFLEGEIEWVEIGKKLAYFIQVNFADEKQKSGLSVSDTLSFYSYCKNEIHLNIIGIMCFPPFGLDPTKFFKQAFELNNKLGLSELSMGMSNDYLKAIKLGSTFVRIGSAIFGERKV